MLEVEPTGWPLKVYYEGSLRPKNLNVVSKSSVGIYLKLSDIKRYDYH